MLNERQERERATVRGRETVREREREAIERLVRLQSYGNKPVAKLSC